MKQVKTALNEKENQRLNHKAEQMNMTVYAIIKKLIKKFLAGEIVLSLIPFWMLVYALNISTLILL